MKVNIDNLEHDLTVIEVIHDDLEVKLSTLGAGIIDIKYIDKFNVKESCVAQPINPYDYINNTAYYGKICGRASGRIDKGILNLDEKAYKLDINWNNISNLHGGYKGISEKIWEYDVRQQKDYTEVTFKTTSLDNESGYPGNLFITVTYKISNNQIEIDYEANCDKTTVCNLTNHTYFNLSGDCKTNALDHEIFFNASKYTNLNNELITTSIDDVNKVMDFREPKMLKEDIFDSSIKNHAANGYDHCFIFDDVNLEKCNAYIYDKPSGRKVEVYTTYPSIVMYACCYPSGDIIAKGRKIQLHDSVCLECQYIPNSVNMNLNDKSVLKTDQTYKEKTIYKFKVE